MAAMEGSGVVRNGIGQDTERELQCKAHALLGQHGRQRAVSYAPMCPPNSNCGCNDFVTDTADRDAN